ncbi:MAG TPA: SAM-dependent chlorinase/fluorinase [Candidatus Binataceae bacterium]|nr:SAM-dependent chlorinase/fluorinase [Candidatus Binataceae bacterium]
MPPRRSASGSADPPIVLLTDFGYRDHYAGVMRGVIATIAPAARVIDLTHGIPPQSVVAGAIALTQSWRYFPPRTIFVGVVDPGVGTDRLSLAIETASGARFIGPDNGLLTLAADEAGIKRAVELRDPCYRLASVSSTFHGRDIFAPAAAYLSSGVRLSSFGPPVGSVIRLDPTAGAEEVGATLCGSVIYIDGFGNLITNLGYPRVNSFAARFRGRRLLVRIRRGAPISILKSYGDAAPGAPLATFGSFGLLELAIRDGSAAAHFAAAIGTRVSIKVVPQSSDG